MRIHSTKLLGMPNGKKTLYSHVIIQDKEACLFFIFVCQVSSSEPDTYLVVSNVWGINNK